MERHTSKFQKSLLPPPEHAAYTFCNPLVNVSASTGRVCCDLIISGTGQESQAHLIGCLLSQAYTT